MNTITHKNVLKSDQFQYDQLGLSRGEIERYQRAYEKPEDFLRELRLSPPNRFGISIYEAAKKQGYIRTDGLIISMALQKLYGDVTGSSQYVYIRKNPQYESIPSMPEDVINDITNFIWNFPGTKRTRPLSDNEKQILFDYYAISREPIYEKTFDEIGKEYFTGSGTREMAERCYNSAIGKLKEYGAEFTKLYDYDMAEENIAMAERVKELESLFDSTAETNRRDKIHAYISECRRKGIEPDWSFINIGYIVIDREARKILLGADIKNFQQLINAFTDKRILQIIPSEEMRRSIRNQSRNFFYHFLIKKIPESIR